MTAKWLSQTPSPPRIPIFYTLKKSTNLNRSEDRSYPGVKAQQREYHYLWIDCSSELLKGKDPTLRILQTNQFHPSSKFTAEISENEITFLDIIIYKGDRFLTDSILDIKTHYRLTETFQHTHFTSCHPAGVKRGFIKGEVTRLLRTNSSQTSKYASKREDILVTSLRGP